MMKISGQSPFATGVFPRTGKDKENERIAVGISQEDAGALRL